MMNIIAIGMLLASLGLVIVLSPEPILVMSSSNDENVLETTNKIAQETLLNVEEKARATKETLVKGVEVVTKPIEKSIGWFRRKPIPEDHFNAAKDKANFAKESIQEASIELKDGALEKLSSTIESNIYNEIGKHVEESKFKTMEATKNVVEKTKELTKDEIDNVYDKTKFIQNIGLRAEEIVEDAYYSGTQTFGLVKDKTHAIVGETQDTFYDTVGYMKEKLQDIVVGTKDELNDISVATKETTSNALDLAKENIYDGIGRSKAAIVDTVQLKKVINGGDSMENFKTSTSNMNENVDEIDKNPNAKIKNSTNNVVNSTEQFYDDMKDKPNNYYHEEDQRIRDVFESTRDPSQDHHSNIEQHHRDIRDYYDRPRDYYKNKDGRQFQKNVRDVPRSYYDNTKDIVENYKNDIKDKTKDVFKGGKNKQNYYNNIRHRINGPISNQHEEGSRSYHATARQKNAHGFRNAHDIIENYYDNTNFKPGKDHIGAVVESMGWHRIGIVPPNHVPSFTSEELMIGNVKYAWHGKDQPSSQENFYNHMSNKDVIHNKLPRKEHSYWHDRQLNNVEYEDDINNKDDYNYKQSQKLKERMQNLHDAHESQQFEREEYAYLTQEELYEDDEETLERNQDVRSWKEVFFKRPKGSLLTLIRALHFFTFSIVYGSSFWMTFVSGIILSKHIPQQQFGYVQSRMFPIYLRILAIGESTLFILQFFMHPWFSANSTERCQLSNFGLMISATLINAYVLEPQATKIMFERLKAEKEEGRGLEIVLPPMEAKQLIEEHKKKIVGINQQFKALHGYSSALNLLSLGGLTSHLWHLAHHLVI